ncbi:MAG TPA: SRPBCC family protein [Gaiellaceae bacterium]|nr:SRPBCC family protein [Gaiellaceae bacterium]
MISFETSVQIERPIDEVFAYVSDPENFPRWNSAVRTVRKTSSGDEPVGSTYAMTRVLPSGRAENELEIAAHDRPREFAIRTLSGPTPFVYRYTLSPRDGGTVVELDAEVELSGAPALVGPLARRAVKRGVDDNFATLKDVLERRSSQV